MNNQPSSPPELTDEQLDEEILRLQTVADAAKVDQKALVRIREQREAIKRAQALVATMAPTDREAVLARLLEQPEPEVEQQVIEPGDVGTLPDV